MAYLGQQPSAGQYAKLDSIAASFNGVLTTFNLTVGAAARSPGTAQNLLISLDGVLQEPGVAYTVSGSTITFTEAVPAGVEFFGVLLGSTYEVGTVADGAITANKLGALSVATAAIQDNAITTAKIPDSAITSAKLANSAVTLTTKVTGTLPLANGGTNATDATTARANLGAVGTGANTWAGTQTGADNVLTGWLTRDIGSTFVDKGTVSTGTITFSYADGPAQRAQVGGAVTLALSNFPPAGNLGVMQLELVNAGSATVTFPTINWVLKNGTFTTTLATYLTDASKTALQTSGIDFIMLWTRNAGTTVYGKIL